NHVLEQLDEAQRGLRGGLADNGAASSKRRGDLARLQRNWEVPGADRADDPDRVLDGHVPFARRAVGDDLTIGAFAFLTKPLERVGGVEDFGLGLGQRFALLEG